MSAISDAKHLGERGEDRPCVLHADVAVFDPLLRDPTRDECKRRGCERVVSDVLNCSFETHSLPVPVVRVGALADEEEHACVPVREEEEHENLRVVQCHD